MTAHTSYEQDRVEKIMRETARTAANGSYYVSTSGSYGNAATTDIIRVGARA